MTPFLAPSIAPCNKIMHRLDKIVCYASQQYDFVNFTDFFYKNKYKTERAPASQFNSGNKFIEISRFESSIFTVAFNYYEQQISLLEAI